MKPITNFRFVSRRLILIVICFSVGLPFVCGKKKVPAPDPNVVADSLWNIIEIVSESDLSEETKNTKIDNLCEQIFISLEPFTPMSIQVRQLAAELHLASDKANRLDLMELLWEDVAYFSMLNRMDGHLGEFKELIDRLSNAYGLLLEDDMNQELTPGIYVTLDSSVDSEPGLLLSITNYANQWMARVIDGCYLSEISALRSCETNVESEVLQSADSLEFSVNWNKDHKRNPNVALAKTFNDSGQNFAREMSAELASGRYSTGDVVTGTITTAAVQGLMSLFASLAATGKASYFNSELIWKPLSNGKLDGRLVITAVNQNTNQPEPNTKKIELPLHFIKLYPHHGAFFRAADYIVTSSLTLRISKDLPQKRFDHISHYHPVFYNEDILQYINENKPAKDFNGFTKKRNFKMGMALQMMRNGWLSHYYTEPKVNQIPPIQQCSVHFFNDGFLGMGKWNKKAKNFEGMAAYYHRNGNEAYEPVLINPTDRREVTLYFPNDIKITAEVVGTTQIGEGEIRYGDGTVYRGGTKNWLADGDGTVVFPNGIIKSGSFSDNKLMNGIRRYTCDEFKTEWVIRDGVCDTIATVSYPDGSSFYGTVNEENKPHGEGLYINDGIRKLMKFDNGLPASVKKPKAVKRGGKSRKRTRKK